jgi:predicted transposase YdaD
MNKVTPKKIQLRYDQLMKRTLEYSPIVVIRFINRMLHRNLPLDSKVTWLDKESNYNDELRIGDFCFQIGDEKFILEVQSKYDGTMAFRIFEYDIRAALKHGKSEVNGELTIEFPAPAVIYLRCNNNTPDTLQWHLKFFDGQQVDIAVPVIKLNNLSPEEMVERDLLPILQFYPLAYKSVGKNDEPRFIADVQKITDTITTARKDEELDEALAFEMINTLKSTTHNAIINSEINEEDLPMNTQILETIEITDYQTYFRELRQEGELSGLRKGRQEGQLEGQRDAFFKLLPLQFEAGLFNTPKYRNYLLTQAEELGINKNAVIQEKNRWEAQQAKASEQTEYNEQSDNGDWEFGDDDDD